MDASVTFGKLFTQTVTASGDVTVPSKASHAHIILVGGGGSGGHCAGSTAGASGGGGGGGCGEYKEHLIPVTPGQVIPVIIGAGGVGSSTSSNDGSATTFDGKYKALGGQRGSNAGPSLYELSPRVFIKPISSGAGSSDTMPGAGGGATVGCSGRNGAGSSLGGPDNSPIFGAGGGGGANGFAATWGGDSFINPTYTGGAAGAGTLGPGGGGGACLGNGGAGGTTNTSGGDAPANSGSGGGGCGGRTSGTSSARAGHGAKGVCIITWYM